MSGDTEKLTPVLYPSSPSLYLLQAYTSSRPVLPPGLYRLQAYTSSRPVLPPGLYLLQTCITSRPTTSTTALTVLLPLRPTLLVLILGDAEKLTPVLLNIPVPSRPVPHRDLPVPSLPRLCCLLSDLLS